MKTLKISGLAVILIFLAGPVFAQEENESTSELIIGGYIDVYYSYNVNNPESSDGNFGTTAVGRIFDGAHNQFALGLAQIKADYSINNTQIVIDLTFGPNGMLANFGNTGTSQIIKQAYITTELMEGLSITAGQYGTHIGYELVDAPDNFHYSLSYLFGNGPFYHTGVKFDYSVSENIALMLGVVNGWDAIFDNNDAKSITLQFALTPNDDFSAYVNWIGGNETDQALLAGDITAYKHMFDLTTSYSIDDKFAIGLNAAYGFNNYNDVKTSWGGAALYLSYAFSERAGIGVRTELFDDSEGVQYLGTDYTGITLTGSFSTTDGAVIFKPEIRYDGAGAKIYYKGENNDLTDSQTTIGLTIIGKF